MKPYRAPFRVERLSFVQGAWRDASGRAGLKRKGQLRSRLAWLALLAAQLAPRAARGEPAGRFNVRAYGAAHGLLNQSARVIAQDRTGFIWAGTDDGAFRFDGQSFRRVGAEQGASPALVVALLADDAGGMWVGSFDGLAHWDGQALRRFGPSDGLPASAPYALLFDGERLLVGTAEGLWWSDDRETFHPEARWPGGSCIELTASAGTLYALAGRALVARPAGREGGAWARVADFPQRLTRIRADRAGRLWATSRQQLWVRPRPGEPFRQLDATLPAPLDAVALKLSEDRAGRLLIGTTAGLARFESDDRWTLFGPAQGVKSTTFYSGIEDTEGSLWIAGSGVQWVGLRSPVRAYGASEGLPAGIVQGVLQTDANTVWVATSVGLAVSDGARWATVPGTEGEDLKALARGADGAVVAVGGGGRVLEVRGRAVTKEGPAEGLPAATITVARFDRAGALWLGTIEAGLWRRAPSGAAPGARYVREAVADMPGYESVLDLVEDDAGRLWAAGNDGAYVREAGGWQRLAARSQNLRSLALARDGHVRLGYQTARPVDAAVRRDGRWVVERDPGVSEAWAPASVNFLGDDPRGRIWIGTGHGVDVVEGAAVQSFTQADGLPDDDTVQQSFHVGPTGDVWFGCALGLAHFEARDAESPPPPPVVLLDLQAGPRRVVLPPRGADGRPLQLAPGTQTVAISYSALGFLKGPQIRFQVRLRPVDAAPRETLARELQYANLAPGAYDFEVRARAPSGAWGEAVHTRWEIRTEWWQTLAFRIGLTLLALSLLGWTAWVRVAQLRARAAVSEERNRVARALHDGLAQSFTGVLLQLEGLKRLVRTSSPPELAAPLERTRELALRGLEEARRSVWAIRGEDDPAARGFVERVEALARRMLAGGREVEVVVAQTGRRWWLPKAVEDELVRIAGECVTNALRHGAARRVTVLLRLAPLGFVLTVEDDGKGFAPDATPRGGAGGEAHGFGLASIARDVARSGGSARFESVRGGGGLVEVTIPRWRWAGRRR